MIILLFIICIPFYLIGQSKNYALAGYTYLLGGEKCPYELVFDIAGTTINGHSLTKRSDGMEQRMKIKGTIDREQHTISFTETTAANALQPALTSCAIDAKLKYILRGNKYFISGTFTGRDRSNMKCSEGAIEFEQPFVRGSLFFRDTATSSRPTAVTARHQADTLYAAGQPPEVVNGYLKITEGVPQYITWNTASCSIQIWDGGVIDKDIITILLNGKEVLTDHVLTKAKKQIILPLNEKVNIITILAGDEGSAPPNTAQMILNDGAVEHKIITFNKQGKSASIVLTRIAENKIKSR